MILLRHIRVNDGTDDTLRFSAQEPDLLLLDEPTNYLDLDSIEWLEGYLKKQDVPMVIVSHDRATLDQLCTKIVETDMGVSKTFEGNYSEYILAKAAWVESQRIAWEKQQKEISRTEDLIQRLSGGANSGRATSAEKVILQPWQSRVLDFSVLLCIPMFGNVCLSKLLDMTWMYLGRTQSVVLLYSIQICDRLYSECESSGCLST